MVAKDCRINKEGYSFINDSENTLMYVIYQSEYVKKIKTVSIA